MTKARPARERCGPSCRTIAHGRGSRLARQPVICGAAPIRPGGRWGIAKDCPALTVAYGERVMCGNEPVAFRRATFSCTSGPCVRFSLDEHCVRVVTQGLRAAKNQAERPEAGGGVILQDD